MNRPAVLIVLFVAVLSVACGGNGEGVSSPTAPTPTPTTTTPPPTTPAPAPESGCTRPSAPQLQVSLDGNHVTFTWSAVNAIDYTIYIGTTPNSSNLVRTNTTQTNYSWNGANRGTYYATVHPRNNCGSGNPSNEVVFTITFG